MASSDVDARDRQAGHDRIWVPGLAAGRPSLPGSGGLMATALPRVRRRSIGRSCGRRWVPARGVLKVGYGPRMTLANEKYLLLTTFRRDGRPVSSPVWAAGLADGTIGFWTSSGSGKAKRLAHTERVTVHPCDGRGRTKAGTSAVAATARLVTGPELDAIRQGIVAKYGFMTKVTKALGTIGGIVKRKRIPYGDRGVVIRVTE